MSAIECVTAGVKDMADGSLRITLEFDPRHAKDAFSLFGARGTSCAIVALTPDAAKQSAQDETIEVDKPKGGQLARLAGMWCSDWKFYDWIESKLECNKGAISENDARVYIISKCNIESRAELDNDPEAADKFHRLIREPYSEYLRSL